MAEKALDFIKKRPGVPVVLDPVLVCKETHDVAVSELCQELIRFFPHVSVITPNLPEAELLAGQEIKTLEDMKTAAQKLHDLGAPAVIIKGGNRLSQDKAVDVFYDGQNFTVLENPVIQGQNAGAGCTFASSIASHLVKGDELLPAIESSKAFVYRAIAQADQYGVRQYEANQNTKIALVSLLTALSVVLGYFLKIQTPTGILTFLDVGIFFAAFYFGSREGAVVGGLAGFLIDFLSGYPQWMFFSLINHGLQGFFAGFKGKTQWLGLILATIVMVGGYALGSTLMNGWSAALPEILPNFMQNMVGMIVGFVVFQSVKKIK